LLLLFYDVVVVVARCLAIELSTTNRALRLVPDTMRPRHVDDRARRHICVCLRRGLTRPDPNPGKTGHRHGVTRSVRVRPATVRYYAIRRKLRS